MRRAIAQLPLLVAVWAVLVAGSALVGTCALLLTTGREQSLAAAAERFDAAGTRDQVAVTVGLGAPDGAAAGGADDDAAERPERLGARVADEVVLHVTQTLAPFAATTSVWAASEPARLELDGPVRLGYLLDADTLADMLADTSTDTDALTDPTPPAATLTAGRWPSAPAGDDRSPVEVAVPATVATALDLEMGDTVTMAATADAPATELVLVGLVEWAGGQRMGRPADAGLPVEGPFLVAPGALVAATGDAARPVARVNVVADPALAGSPTALAGTGAAVAALRGVLDDALEQAAPGRVGYVTVRSGLPGFVDAGVAEQGRTAAILVTVVLLVLTLTAAALGQVMRLVVARRAAETALLVDRGAGRRRLAGRALGEALVIGIAASTAAVPAAVVGYRALVGGPLADAWRAPGTPVPGGATPLTPLLLASVAAVAALQVAIAVAAAVRVPVRRRRAVGTVARSGLDVALVALAVLGYLQLRAHRPAGTSVDPVLALAPVLCVLAGAALVLRVLPAAVRLAELRARRSRGLVAPLAAWHVARGRATSGVFLLVVATAAATFALGFSTTWAAAQQDQADAATGADVVVPSDAPGLPTGADGTADAGAVIDAAEEAAGGPVTAMAVTRRPAGLGSRVGGVTLVGVDTAGAAGPVLRGRLPDGRGWDDATAALTPEPGAGLDLPGRAQVVVTGTVDEPLGPAGRTIGKLPVEALVELVLVDPAGGRTLLPAGTVRLDGEPHPLAVALPRTDGWQLVAVDALLTTDAELTFGVEADVPVTLRVEVTGPAGTAGTAEGDAAAPDAWTVATNKEIGVAEQLLRSCGEVTPGGDLVDAACRVELFSLGFGGAHVLVAGFAAPEAVPVLLPQALADDLAATTGDELSLGVGTTTIPATVAGTVPYVPGATDPGTVLVDTDALTRALVVRGALEPTTDAWWFATSEPGAVAAALGGTSRDELAADLRAGPLRAAIPAALWLLVAAAVLLAVAGASAQAAAVTHERGLETARLRSIGVPRRALVATGMVQHLLVSAGAVGAGALLGVLLTTLLSPVLVLGPTGGAAVPAVQLAWPWAALAAVLVTLLVGCVAVAVPAVVRLTRRADVTALRLGDAA